MGPAAAVKGKRPAAAVKDDAGPAAAVKGDKSKSPTHPEGKMPTSTIEASRSQVLFRSGLAGKGQNKVFKYTDEATKKRAIASAAKMVVEEKLRRGFT